MEYFNLAVGIILLYDYNGSSHFRDVKKHAAIHSITIYLKVEDEDTEKDVSINIKKVNKKRALR